MTVAQFRGQCADCGGQIEVGVEIMRRDDLEGWAHVKCDPALDALIVRPNEAVCPQCWTIHNGECL